MDVMAPLAGQFLLGMKDPIRQPKLAPGMSPFDAMYSQRVTGPQWARTEKDVLTGLGMGLADDIGKAGTQLGLNNIMGVSATQMERTLAEKGRGSAGRMLAGVVANSPMAKEIMGGDVLGMHKELFRNRHALAAIPGDPIGPMDVQGQEVARAHAMDFGGQLTKAIRGTENGGIGMLPDYGFTRGYRDEQIGEVAARMTERGAGTKLGAGTMRGADVPAGAKVEAVGQMNKTLEALGDLIGSDDISQLFKSLDKLTQNQWPDINPAALEDTFRNMKASADMLGTSAGQMISTTNAMQSVMKGSLAPGLGQSGGGYTQLPVGQMMAENVMAIAQTTGKTSPQDIERITQQQGGLMAVGMQSTQGRDLQMIEYAREKGMVSEADYADLQGTIASGSKMEQQGLAQSMLKKAFGSEAEVSHMKNDPNMLAFMRENTSARGARNVAGSIMTAQQTEYTEVVRKELTDSLDRRNQDMVKQTGRRRAMPKGERADLEMQVVKDYFATGRGDSPEVAEALQATFQAKMEENQQKVDDGDWTVDRQKSVAMRAVDRDMRMQTDDKTIAHLRGRRNEAVQLASQQAMGGEDVQQEAATKTALDTITSLSTVSDPIKKRAREIRRMKDPLAQAAALEDLKTRGTPAGFELTEVKPADAVVKRMEEIQKMADPEKRAAAFEDLKGGVVTEQEVRSQLTATDLGTVERRVEQQQGGFKRQQALAQAEKTALRHTSIGARYGMGLGDVAKEQQGLSVVLDNVLDTGMAKQARLEAIATEPGFSDNQRERMTAAVKSDNLDDLRSAATDYVQGMRTLDDESGERRNIIKSIATFDPDKPRDAGAREAGLDQVVRDHRAGFLSSARATKIAEELPLSDKLRERATAAFSRVDPAADTSLQLQAVGTEQVALGSLMRDVADERMPAAIAAEQIERMDQLTPEVKAEALKTVRSGKQAQIQKMAEQQTAIGQVAGDVMSGRQEQGKATATIKAMDLPKQQEKQLTTAIENWESGRELEAITGEQGGLIGVAKDVLSGAVPAAVGREYVQDVARGLPDKRREAFVEAFETFAPGQVSKTLEASQGVSDILRKAAVGGRSERKQAGSALKDLEDVSDEVRQQAQETLDSGDAGGMLRMARRQGEAANAMRDAMSGKAPAAEVVERINAITGLSDEQRASMVADVERRDPDKLEALLGSEQKVGRILRGVQSDDISPEVGAKQLAMVKGIDNDRRDELIDKVQAYKPGQTLRTLIDSDEVEEPVKKVLSQALASGDIGKAFEQLDALDIEPAAKQQAQQAMSRFELGGIAKAAPGPSQSLAEIAKAQSDVNTQLEVRNATAETTVGMLGYGDAIKDSVDAQRTRHAAEMQAPGLANYQGMMSDMSQGLRATLPQLAIGFIQGRTTLGGMLGLEEADFEAPESKASYILGQVADGNMKSDDAIEKIKGLEIDGKRKKQMIDTMSGGGNRDDLRELAREEAQIGAGINADMRKRIKQFEGTAAGKEMKAGVDLVAAGQDEFQGAKEQLDTLFKDELTRDSGGSQITETALQEFTTTGKVLTVKEQAKQMEVLDTRLEQAGVAEAARGKLVGAVGTSMDAFRKTKQGQALMISGGKKADKNEETKALMQDMELKGRLDKRAGVRKDVHDTAVASYQDQVFAAVGTDSYGGAFAADFDEGWLAENKGASNELAGLVKEFEATGVGGDSKTKFEKLTDMSIFDMFKPHTPDTDPVKLHQNLMEVARELTPEAIAKQTPKQQDILRRMGEVKLRKQASELGEDAGTEDSTRGGGGGRGKQGKQTLEFSGQLLLKNDRGGTLGNIEMGEATALMGEG